MNGYNMQKFLSFSDGPVKEKVEIPTEYSAYLEKMLGCGKRTTNACRGRGKKQSDCILHKVRHKMQLTRTEDGKLKVVCSKVFVSELVRQYKIVQKYKPIVRKALLKKVRER